MNFLTCHIKPQSPSDFKHNNLFKGQFFQVTLLLNQLSHRHKKAMSEWCQLLNISPINFATPKRSGDQQRPYLSPMRCTENCQTLHPNFSMPQINSLTHLHWRLKSLIVKINSLSSWFKQNLLKMKIRFKKKKKMLRECFMYFVSVQFSHPVMSDSLQPHGLQHASLPCPSDHHQLPELAQTRVHRVGDATQLSHPLSSPSPPDFNLSQDQGLFQWVGSFYNYYQWRSSKEIE